MLHTICYVHVHVFKHPAIQKARKTKCSRPFKGFGSWMQEAGAYDCRCGGVMTKLDFLKWMQDKERLVEGIL